MRTLFAAYRISDLERSLERSLDLYTALGYRKLRRVAFDEADPVEVGGFDHLAIQVDDLAETLAALTGRGLAPGPPGLPGGPDDPSDTQGDTRS